MTVGDIELRHLPSNSLYAIATVLEINSDWKKVMSSIPIDPKSEDFIAKYNHEDIKLIEDHARATNRKCAEILFNEWGSSGRIRPTLKTLQEAVQKAEILRVADDIAMMLGEALPERPTSGPGAPIPLDYTAYTEMESNIQSVEYSINLPMQSERLRNVFSSSSQDVPNISAFKDLGDKTSAKMKSENDLREYSDELYKNYESNIKLQVRNIMSNSTDSKEVVNEETFPIKIKINTEILNNSQLVTFSYQKLVRITDNFGKNGVSPGGPTNRKSGIIGRGGFADVYLGHLHNYGLVAVKKLRPNRDYKKIPEILNNNFNSEIQFLSLFKHTNIVHIIGYSIDGLSPCIVCEYIEGGTLEKNIEEKTLNEKQRINIMIGVADALKFLHSDITANMTRSILAETGSQSQKNFVHGDLKTANILLTKDYVPKLCDFAAGKQYDVTSYVLNAMGTPSYLAPEQARGTVTQETDIYHYGRILLELLTGLKSIVQTKSGPLNLLEYLEDNCQNDEITNCLDKSIDRWTKAAQIYSLAKGCLKERKQRPSADEICKTLKNMG